MCSHRWPGSAPTPRRSASAPASPRSRRAHPAATAMHAMTLDHLSNGRVILGLGVSGPQVVEGWYGQPFAKPLSRTRAYIEIIQNILARGRTGHPAQRALPAPLHRRGLVGPREASPLDRPPATVRPAHLPRRRRAEERRSRCRTLQRLAAAVLLALTGPRSTRSRSPAEATASRSPTAPASGSTTTSPKPCCRSSSPSPSTSAAWAQRTGTSTAS